MSKDMMVMVKATGIKAFICQVLGFGVIQIECATTGRKTTLMDTEVEPFTLMH